jgi:hypothetical protein
MFGSVLCEIQRILESVDVEDGSHEACAVAVERRFRASRDLVGQRSLELSLDELNYARTKYLVLI